MVSVLKIPLYQLSRQLGCPRVMPLNLTPTAEQYTRAIDPLLERMEQRGFDRIGRLTQAFRREYYRLVKRILVERTLVIDCYAG